jgi:hypothetical protein
MDKNDNKRQQLISGMLGADCLNKGADVGPWRRLAAHLSPLIGESGFAALYGRAARLVQTRFPWFVLEQSSPSADSLFDHLDRQLSSVDATLAAETNMALLDTFTKLLSGLIGDALTIRLLNSAWSDESHQGNAKEQK